MRRSPKHTVTGVLSLILPSSSPPYDKTSINRQPASNQVFRLPVKRLHLRAIVFLFLIVSSMAYPRIEAETRTKPGAVYFSACKRPTNEQLQKRMGPYFDSSRMASSADTLKLGQGAGADQGSELSDEEDMDDIQGDDPDAYSDVMYGEDAEDEDYPQDDQEEEDEEEGKKDKTQVYRYMRRRRGVSEEDVPHASRVTKRGSSNDFATFHLKLALSDRKNNGHRTHDGKSRKQLKQELRKSIKKSKKDPPWECKMQPEYLKMREGIFPRYVIDGRCKTDKCFFRIYNCVPKKYKIRVLERDPERCNPLPLIGANTTYEEKWIFRSRLVTVGCNCERRQTKKRRRH